VVSRSPAAEEQSDEELVSLYVRNEDRAALERLVRRYAPRLRRIILSLTQSEPEAVYDAEQEIFATLIRRLGNFSGRSAFSTYFFRLARNKLIDLARSRQRYGRRVMSLVEPDSHSSGFPQPEDLAIKSERVRQLRTALYVLRPEDRMMLYLKDGEGVGIEELGEMTGLKAGTIKSRLARGRVKVAKALEEMGYEHE